MAGMTGGNRGTGAWLALAALGAGLGLWLARSGQADEPAAAPPKLQLSRADLAGAYLRFDHLFAARPPAPEKLADLNQRFDAETKAFFSGNLAQVARGVNALAATLRADPETKPNQPFADSLKIRITPRAFVAGSTAAPHAWYRPVYKVTSASAAPVRCVLRLKGPDGKVAAEAPFSAAPDADSLAAAALPLPVAVAKLPVGRYQLILAGEGMDDIEGDQWYVVPRDLEELRAENEAKLAQVDASSPALQQALAACQARNALLVTEPSEANSAEFLADPNSLAKDVAAEIEQLLAGKDPYRGRGGDYWRVVREGKTNVPCRVYAPASIAGKEKVPLVIALHGAGGDENMFMDAYGAGMIKQLADRHGFLAVSPATFYFVTGGKYFDRLVEALGFDYPIDPDRIYVLGHSMGGGATSFLARERADKIAAACCLAGGRGFPTMGAFAPTLVIAAELDGLIPAKAIQESAEKAAAAGTPIEFRLLRDYGHTLMVGNQLPVAVEWLLARRRGERPQG